MKAYFDPIRFVCLLLAGVLLADLTGEATPGRCVLAVLALGLANVSAVYKPGSPSWLPQDEERLDR